MVKEIPLPVLSPEFSWERWTKDFFNKGHCFKNLAASERHREFLLSFRAKCSCKRLQDSFFFLVQVGEFPISFPTTRRSVFSLEGARGSLDPISSGGLRQPSDCGPPTRTGACFQEFLARGVLSKTAIMFCTQQSCYFYISLSAHAARVRISSCYTFM